MLPGPARACFDPALERAYLVSPDGDDTGPGTIESPFATIAQALKAMRTGRVRHTFVRDGHYSLEGTLELDNRDNGVSVTACPLAFPIIDGTEARLHALIHIDGVREVAWRGFDFVGGVGDTGAIYISNSARIRLRESRFTRHDVGIVLEGSSDCDISHNTVRDSRTASIELKDHSDANLIADNLVDGTQTAATHGGGIFLHGASHNRIVRNQVQHTDGAGITVANWDSTTINLDNLIADNVVVDVNRKSQDSGAIYVLGRSHADTRTCIQRNLIDGTGAGEAAHTIGIYLDDSASGVLVQGNRMRRIGTHAFEVHGGDDVRIEGNLLDLRAGGANAMLVQTAPLDTGPSNTMSGNVFRRNLVVMDASERRPYEFLNGGRTNIEANIYLIPPAWKANIDNYGDAPIFVDPARSAPIEDLFWIWSRPDEALCQTRH